MEDNNKPENPNAFATSSPSCQKYDAIFQEGMTLRDYFAAKAMSGMMEQPIANISQNTFQIFETVAKQSYMIADAMLKERSKQ